MTTMELKSELRNNIELLRGNSLRLTIDNITRQFNSLKEFGNAILEIEKDVEKAYFFPKETNKVILFTNRYMTTYMNENFK